MKATYKISNNEDWANLNQNEPLVDISNDAYFGFRAMEKDAKSIVYDPLIVNTLVRVVKEGKKFPDTIHCLFFDKETIGFEFKDDTEAFIKRASEIVNEILVINPILKIDFITNANEEEKVLEILRLLFQENLARV